MDIVDRGTQRLDRLNAAATFLDTVRRRCPNAEVIQIFDDCLVEYQAALIALLISEELRGTPVAGSRHNGYRARKDENGESTRLTHDQLIIARAHNYEQHLQAQASYLEVRQRLKKTLISAGIIPRHLWRFNNQLR